MIEAEKTEEGFQELEWGTAVIIKMMSRIFQVPHIKFITELPPLLIRKLPMLPGHNPVGTLYKYLQSSILREIFCIIIYAK